MDRSALKTIGGQNTHNTLPEEALRTQQTALLKIIDDLPHLTPENKTWAKEDVMQKLGQDHEFAELEQKYRLYDQLGEIRQEILKNIPSDKRTDFHRFLDETIINPSSHGQPRELKREQLQKIYRTVLFFRESQVDLQLIVHKNIVAADVDFGVLKILNEDFYKTFEKIFPSRFWKTAEKMSPQLFPNFTDAFNFSVQQTFAFQQSLEKIKEFPASIKEAVLLDAEEILSQTFPAQESQQELQRIKALPENNPQNLLEKLQALEEEKNKRLKKAEQETKKAQSYASTRNIKEAFSVLEALKDTYGEDIFKTLGGVKFWREIQVQISWIHSLEKNIAQAKSPEQKKKLLTQLHKVQIDPEYGIEIKNLNAAERKKRSEELVHQIQTFRQHGQLQTALSTAKRLQQLDAARAQKLIQDIQAQAESQTESLEGKHEKSAETSIEKETKMKFLERCIEHAEKVMEECSRLGIPTDDTNFWGEGSPPDRVKWLRKHGFLETYRKFNATDSNMPKRQDTGGFRYRWLDAQTGSNLSIHRATEGLKYLQRYKESGYTLAALAGGFSIDWASSGPNYLDPQSFIDIVTAELADIRGTSLEKAA